MTFPHLTVSHIQMIIIIVIKWFSLWELAYCRSLWKNYLSSSFLCSGGKKKFFVVISIEENYSYIQRKWKVTILFWPTEWKNVKTLHLWKYKYLIYSHSFLTLFTKRFYANFGDFFLILTLPRWKFYKPQKFWCISLSKRDN